MNTLNFARFLSTQPIVTLSTVGVDSLPYAAIIAEVKRQLARVYTKRPGILPPIAQLEAGDVVFVGIEPTHARIGNFDRKDGDEEVYHDATE